jgi:hypothetical protein
MRWVFIKNPGIKEFLLSRSPAFLIILLCAVLVFRALLQVTDPRAFFPD